MQTKEVEAENSKSKELLNLSLFELLLLENYSTYLYDKIIACFSINDGSF